MIKLKYLSPILFVLFFLVSKTNVAQVTDSKPTLAQALKEVFSETETKKKSSIIDSKEKNNSSKTDVKKKEKASSLKNQDLKKVDAISTENKKVKKTTLKSRKGNSDLMNALREALKN